MLPVEITVGAVPAGLACL